jgi:Holliday junction resolvase
MAIANGGKPLIEVKLVSSEMKLFNPLLKRTATPPAERERWVFWASMDRR